MIRYVPIQLIQYCITNGLAKQLRLFLYLKHVAESGIIQDPNADIANTIEHLGISKRTYNRHIKDLRDLKFIDNDKRGVLYLRSWKRLETILGLKFKSRVDFHISYIRVKTNRGYLMGAVMSYQCKLKNYLTWRERENRRSLLVHDLQHPLSITYLANLLKISKSTAQSYRAEAIKHSFVIRTKNVEVIDVQNKNIDINLLRRGWTENSFPKLKDGKLFILKTDTFKPQLRFKRYR